jgi:undecaprenyl-diphosphatase
MLFRLDDYLFHLVYAGGPGGSRALTIVAIVLSAIGEGRAMLAILPLAVVPTWRRFAAWLTGTLAVTAIVVFALKALVGRGRPFTVYEGLRGSLLDSPTDHSFPSGHAAGSMAFALFVSQVLLAQRPRAAYAVPASIALVFLAASIGVSRVMLGFHFPLDVLAGTVLGAAIGTAAGRRFVRGGAAG